MDLPLITPSQANFPNTAYQAKFNAKFQGHILPEPSRVIQATEPCRSPLSRPNFRRKSDLECEAAFAGKEDYDLSPLEHNDIDQSLSRHYAKSSLNS
jgi:hypothetical protein